MIAGLPNSSRVIACCLLLAILVSVVSLAAGVQEKRSISTQQMAQSQLAYHKMTQAEACEQAANQHHYTYQNKVQSRSAYHKMNQNGSGGQGNGSAGQGNASNGQGSGQVAGGSGNAGAGNNAGGNGNAGGNSGGRGNGPGRGNG